MKARNILIALAIKNKGNWEQTYLDIQDKRYPSEEEISKAENVQCITILDEEYPETLKQGFKPPFVLFYKGNKELLNDTNMLAVVGSRNPNQATLDFTQRFVAKRNETIISELSLGTNEKVLKTALKNGNGVIAVLGSGIDNCYPTSLQTLYTEIALKGLLISELPLDTAPDTNSMMSKKRITAHLAKNVCVMDIKENSSTNMLVTFALQVGKEIFVKPDLESEDSYANQLIEDGANCLTLATQLE